MCTIPVLQFLFALFFIHTEPQHLDLGSAMRVVVERNACAHRVLSWECFSADPNLIITKKTQASCDIWLFLSCDANVLQRRTHYWLPEGHRGARKPFLCKLGSSHFGYIKLYQGDIGSIWCLRFQNCGSHMKAGFVATLFICICFCTVLGISAHGPSFPSVSVCFFSRHSLPPIKCQWQWHAQALSTGAVPWLPAPWERQRAQGTC